MYQSLVLDKITWHHTTLYQLLVLGKDTWNYMNVFIILIRQEYLKLYTCIKIINITF